MSMQKKKKKIIYLIKEEKFNKFWKGMHSTTFSDHNVLCIIKTKWRFGGENHLRNYFIKVKIKMQLQIILKIMKMITQLPAILICYLGCDITWKYN